MADKSVLFICTGNTCRSPMAEFLFRSWLGPNSEWAVTSAGIAALPGRPATAAAIEVCREKGVDLTPHRSRELTRELVDQARLIVVMTRMHRDFVTEAYPEAKAKVFLLTSFGADRENPDIEDPIECETGVYRHVCAQIDAALSDLALYLHEKHGPAARKV